MNPDLLIEYLVKEELLNEAEAMLALNHQSTGCRSLEQTLIDNELISEHEILQAMSKVYDIPYIKLDPSNLDAELASCLPKALMETYCVYPLKREQGDSVLQMAMADPFDISAIDTFRYITGLQISPILALREEILSAVSGELLGKFGLQIIADRVPWDSALEALQTTSARELESENSTPIIQLVSSILTTAIRGGASDIHFEPHEDVVRVRYRIDGILQEIVELPKRVTRACVARMKIVSNLDISECRKPQDGRTEIRLNEGVVDMRVSTLPTVWGEKVVLRILDRTGAPPTLSQLGLRPKDLEQLKSYLNSSHGMILLTGPTGSGKTSTLYAALNLLNKPGVNITTVEDPVEYQMEGVSQVAVNPKAGLTFCSALRSFLRQDPDIIMVGEIRDLETAQIAVQAAQTGHLVFSTLHTNDAPSTLERLVLMGLEAHSAAGSLLCVIAQRLVRRLCSHCRKEDVLTAEQSKLLALSYEHPTPDKVWTSEGCEECSGTGYKGRLGLFELLPVSGRLRQQMLDDPSEELLWRVAREEGMTTLLEDGLIKAEQGLTSVEEVLRVVTVRRRLAESEESHGHPRGEESRQGDLSGPCQWNPPVRVMDVMTPEVRTVSGDEKVSEVTRKLLEWGVTGSIVLDEKNHPVGVISFNDIAAFGQVAEGQNGDTKVQDIMSPWLIKVHPYTPLRRAFILFQRHKVHRLAVIQGSKLLGVVTPLDLVLRAERFCTDRDGLWN